MEKIAIDNTFSRIGGDQDEDIDWEDFIIVQGKITFGEMIIHYRR